MNILSLHTGHDSAVCLFEDYELIFISKEERLIRHKGYGGKYPFLSLAKAKAKYDFNNIDMLALTRGVYSRYEAKNINFFKNIENRITTFLKGKEHYFYHTNDMNKTKTNRRLSDFEILDKDKLKKCFGVNLDADVGMFSHHRAHALPCLFYKSEWENALIYSADGGGDFFHYNIYYFDGQKLKTIHGDDEKTFDKDLDENGDSLGRMYGCVTEMCGFKRLRHEGKITGLAAFGKPTIYKEIKDKFYIENNGKISAHFRDSKEMGGFLRELAKDISREDLASSAQKVLEDVMIESILKLKENYNISNIGLSGGVFANVRLNQKISEIDGVKDVFVLPFMGDEGLVVGAALDVLMQKKGFDSFLANRRELGMPYFGEDFGDIKSYVDTSKFEIIEDSKENIVKKTVELLKDKKICAIFTKGMEYGPRALGARSILIDPSDKSINDSVNKRLSRTEFMPFAPYVRIERVRDVFEVTESNLDAMKYMTITCDVKKEWHDKMPAVVHVDGTARPQTIAREDNPLYYDILHEFEKQTGIPCLVNTSFNAHEEPIINTPEEALKALEDDRVDYLIAQDCIVGQKG